MQEGSILVRYKGPMSNKLDNLFIETLRANGCNPVITAYDKESRERTIMFEGKLDWDLEPQKAKERSM